MNTAAAAAARPTDLVITRALSQRRKRVPNFQVEAAAFSELSQLVADDPRRALRRFLDVALQLCNAGTAGLSFLQLDSAGQTTVHWEAVNGALASHEGTDAPRDFSPCGLCLDAGVTMLISKPERVFTYLHVARPSIVENLIVPLYDKARKPLGTFWLAHHDPSRGFCSDDVRIVEQLAIHLLPALKLLEATREHRYALALIESHQLAQRNFLARDLADERNLREQAEASESALRQAIELKDAMIQEVHHRAKNTLQVATSLLSLQTRQSSSAQVRRVLQDSHNRILLLAKVHELLYVSADNAQEILMPVLLQTIGDALRQSFAETSSRVRLEVAADPIILSADEAIPVALLANEALTNAYKHAFPDDRAGVISVSLSCAPENAIILRIMDSGVGMTSTAGESGLGLKLMRGFAAQLQATVAFSKPTDTEGTVVTLRIHRAVTLRSVT